MPARYVTVCDQQYNKKQFGNKWSEIVSGYETGQCLYGSDEKFVSDVLSRIPRFASVMKRGRYALKVVQKTFNGKRVRGIVLVTPNSRFEMWAGKQAVVKAMFPPANAPDPGKVNRKNVLKALRSIIEPQVQQYRSRFSGKSVIKSSVSGKPIFGPYHVDHVYPFIRLVEEWCRENGLDLETMPVKCYGAQCRLSSVDMAESWFDYHAFHAEFQILDASENVSKGSKYFGRGKYTVEDP